MYLVRLTRTEDDKCEVFNYHADYESEAYQFMERVVNILGMNSPEDNKEWVVTHGDVSFTLDFHYLTPIEEEDDLEGFLHRLIPAGGVFSQDKAFEEGWCIAECSGSSYIPEGWLEIQNLDEADIFEDDWGAQAWVANLAANESEYHRQAIRYMESMNYALVRKLQEEFDK